LTLNVVNQVYNTIHTQLKTQCVHLGLVS